MNKNTLDIRFPELEGQYPPFGTYIVGVIVSYYSCEKTGNIKCWKRKMTMGNVFIVWNELRGWNTRKNFLEW